MSLPDVVSREQWLEARRRLLAQEKEMTRRHDELNASRRRLPMVKVDKEYVFDGPGGKVTLAQLFGDKRQLVVQHVMFGPDWDQPCPAARPPSTSSPRACSSTSLRGTPRSRLISRAPVRENRRQGEGTRLDRRRGIPPMAATSITTTRSRSTPNAASPTTTTAPSQACSAATGPPRCPATAASCAKGDEVFHTYSAFARGTEYVGNAYTFLDMTALGRQEDWEEPKGRSAATRGGDPTFTS